ASRRSNRRSPMAAWRSARISRCEAGAGVAGSAAVAAPAASRAVAARTGMKVRILETSLRGHGGRIAWRAWRAGRSRPARKDRANAAQELKASAPRRRRRPCPFEPAQQRLPVVLVRAHRAGLVIEQAAAEGVGQHVALSVADLRDERERQRRHFL